MGGFNEAYFSRVNHDLLSLIPSGVNSILEVGCGSGSMGSLYKLKYPSASYYGIELNQSAAAFARKKIDKVFCVDVENFDSYKGLIPGVDCLVYGDVLEHLKDPWRVLLHHKGLLHPGGCVLACIPNVQHWTVLMTLMSGRWPVLDEGLFDRTHLRWFTKSGIEELFRGSGFELIELHARVAHQEQSRVFVDAMRPALEALKLNAEQFSNGVSAFQYIVIARKGS